jgi:hypothetical protein
MPLLIGGSRRRLIELEAKRADTVSIAPTTGADGRRAVYWDVEIDDRVRWAREAAADRPVPPEIDLAIHECGPESMIARVSAARGIGAGQVIDPQSAHRVTRASRRDAACPSRTVGSVPGDDSGFGGRHDGSARRYVTFSITKATLANTDSPIA